jgi:elongation factor Ts
MANITADMVKELRERTGAGMMECKKALVASNGNIDLAIDEMRKAGQAKADKKASRVAAEGVIVIKANTSANQVAMIEINCETDFVARDASFKQFAEKAAEASFNSGATEVSGLDSSVDDARRELITKLGENITVRRVYGKKSAHHFGTYNHGGQIGVVVEVKGGTPELAKDLAMHIAANRPLVVLPTEVSADLIAKEKEIFIAQAKDSGKPADIIEKMTQGRIQKFLDEMSLVGQPFVKDPAQKVSSLLKQHNAEVIGFARFEAGEGIEKKTVDFAKEVMAQVRGA